MLKQKQHLLGSVWRAKPGLAIAEADYCERFMSDKIMPMSEAVEGYDLFDKMKAQKGRTAP